MKPKSRTLTTMMRSASPLALAGSIFLLLWCSAMPAPALEAGAAKVEITGPLGAPMNGYGDRMGRGAVAVHDPLWAHALYLDDGTTRLFLVSLDLVMINQELRERVLELAPQAVPKENIILCATHTHSGQGAMCKTLPLRAVSGRFMPEVLEATAQGIVKAMNAACEGRKRAAIGYGTGVQNNLSSNRRYPGGPIDPQIGVLLVTDADGNPIAVLTNFAAHPTSVPHSDEYSYSCDYPGFYYDEMEKVCAPGAVPFFLNGAEGNQTIANPQNKDEWERTESVGRLLAQRAKEIMKTIACGDAKLRFSAATPELPRTMAGQFQPRSTTLQTLEINDLFVAFFPGEACVELALSLREQALARGYAAQFSVGLSNDYLMYFIPRKFYAHVNYESSMNFFGPAMEDWFYREFGKLMSKGTPAAAPVVDNATPEQIEGGLHLKLRGSPYALGVQRGKAFGDDIRARYQRRVNDPVESGAWLPKTGGWAYWPKFLDARPLALPIMAMAARPLLEGVSDQAVREMEGLADGAELPFDAIWLLQNAGRIAVLDDKAPIFQSTLCTIFAATGDRAGADGLLIGRNLDWADDELPIVTEVHPDEGHAFVQVGFGWNEGVFTGMNDAGLVLCLELLPGPPAPDIKGAPPEILLRDLLQSVDRPAQALEALRAQTHLRGCHVLIAGYELQAPPPAAPAAKNGRKNGKPAPPPPLEQTPRAWVLEFGDQVAVREPVNGLLLASDPAAVTTDPHSKMRYARAAALLENERIIGQKEAKRVLGDEETGREGLAQIHNPQTRHSVLFEPKKRAVHVAFPGPHASGAYTTISLSGGTSHE